MLIFQHQIDALAGAANSTYLQRLAVYLRKAHGTVPIQIGKAEAPLGSLSEGDLFVMVAGCVEKGRGHGLTWESSLAAMTVLMFLYGPRFDEKGEIQREMGRSEVPRELLPDHLVLTVPESMWRDARKEYPGGWNLSRSG
jgi:hypothetical protein